MVLTAGIDSSVLLGRLAFAGGLLALLGLAQFATNQVLVDRLSIPGLTANTAIYGAQSREGFTRPSGTAVHPIEYGAVLSMLLPLAIAGAVNSSKRAVIHWAAAAGIFLCILLSSSRSAFLSCGVAVVVLIPGLAPKHRKGAFFGLGASLVGVFLLVPGMLGTIAGLFLGVGNDSSSQSRFDSYSVAWAYFEQAPAFGRGLSTFLPRYRIFDNQYLVLLVEIGLVGLVSILLLFVSAIYAGTWARKNAATPKVALSAQSLVAGATAGASSLALFDAFSFPMVPGLLFLLLGLIGALWRIVKVSSAGSRPSSRAVDATKFGLTK